MGRPSAVVSRRWRSRRSSPRRDRHGRMPTSSASSARSAANVSITSSSSTGVTCAECCRHTLSITTEAERISRSARIVRSLGPYSHPLLAPLSPFQRSAACTIATSVAQPEWFAVAEPAQPSRCRGSSRPAISSREWHSAPNRCLGLRSPQRSTLWSNDQEASARVRQAAVAPRSARLRVALVGDQTGHRPHFNARQRAHHDDRFLASMCAFDVGWAVATVCK